MKSHIWPVLTNGSYMALFFCPFSGVVYAFESTDGVDFGCYFLMYLIGGDEETHLSNTKRGENMAANRKQTSAKVATKASQILRDGRYCSKAKSVAGSALAQTKPSGKRK